MYLLSKNCFWTFLNIVLNWKEFIECCNHLDLMDFPGILWWSLIFIGWKKTSCKFLGMRNNSQFRATQSKSSLTCSLLPSRVGALSNRSFKPLLHVLSQKSIKYWWSFPFRLSFTYQNKMHDFTSTHDGNAFYSTWAFYLKNLHHLPHTSILDHPSDLLCY